MVSFAQQRRVLVESQIRNRGITDPAVLAAMEAVPREAFLSAELAEFAYADHALPIEKGQTISQPYIVALMAEALQLKPQDRVLEVGTGSGYAAAVLSTIASQVYTVERHEELAELAALRLHEQGFDNVHVKYGDGTLGWPEESPFDAIVVAAGGPELPRPLLEQLTIGGRLVIPLGAERTLQRLLRVTRTATDRYKREELAEVRFVPLIGAAGWRDGAEVQQLLQPAAPSSRPTLVAELVVEVAEPLQEIEGADLGSILERVSDSRLVLIGESTHGTSEFYRMRAELTKRLIERRGMRFVAIEGDWPDVARVDAYVRLSAASPSNGDRWEAFARFPTWMWRNHEVLDFVEWLRGYNQTVEDPAQRVGFYGLDLYSMFTSIRAVLDYLDRVDPQSAEIARLRYGCLTPWEGDPSLYGRLAVSGRYRVCEDEAVAMLSHLLARRLEYAQNDGRQLIDVIHNARLVADAERYYRAMYYGAHESWNLRDQHMFDTLELLLRSHGDASKAVVWEHNSHLGDASATEVGASGQTNVGELCRKRFGPEAYLIGQGTDHGTVAAAANWDEQMQVMEVRPGYPGSFESLFHDTQVQAFMLPLREPRRAELREELSESRLQRAIGVVYRPDTELASHYYHAILARQFDEYIWFDRTTAVNPISRTEAAALVPTHPFALSL